MSDIRFEGEETYAPSSAARAQKKGLTGLVVKWGLAKNERSAQYLLLGIAVLAVILAFFVLMGSGVTGSGAPLPLPPA